MGSVSLRFALPARAVHDSGTADPDHVSGVVGQAFGVRERFQQTGLPNRLKHGRPLDGAHDGNRLALVLFDEDADLRVRNQAVHLEQLRQFLFQLEGREAPGANLDRKQRKGDVPGLADAHLAREVGHVEDLDTQQVACTDNVFALPDLQGCSKLKESLVGVLCAE